MKLPFANDGRVRLDLSSDGAHVIASVHEGDRERCVWSGRELPDVAWLRGRSPERQWSAGASRRAAIVRQGQLVRVVTSDAQRDVWSEPQEDARVSRSAFRRGDDRFAYFAKRRGAWWIDREGEEPVGPFDEIASLAWHGAHLVGVVRLGEAWRVWIDGRALPCRTSRPNVHVAHGSVALVDGRDGVSEVLHDDRVIGPFTTQRRPVVVA